MITTKEVQRVLMLVGVSQVVHHDELDIVRKHFDLVPMFEAVTAPLENLANDTNAGLAVLIQALKEEFPEFVVTVEEEAVPA